MRLCRRGHQLVLKAHWSPPRWVCDTCKAARQPRLVRSSRERLRANAARLGKELPYSLASYAREVVDAWSGEVTPRFKKAMAALAQRLQRNEDWLKNKRRAQMAVDSLDTERW